MNEQPTENNELAGVEAALQRAAKRARERARATGTRLVVSRSGVIHYLRPEAGDAGVAEENMPYDSE